MKVLIYLGHPAHFHFYKNIIHELMENKHKVFVIIKKKDMLEDLLEKSGIPYYNILPEGRRHTRLGIVWALVKRDFKLIRFCMKVKPDMQIGSSVEITHVTKFLKIPSVVTVEDDIQFVKPLATLGYPFATNILVPTVCNVGKFAPKTSFYAGYQKLAYLHPHRFTPDREKVRHLFNHRDCYFIIRVVSFTAYHDFSASGLTDQLTLKLIDYLHKFGHVYISAERELPVHLKQYELPIAIEDIHHALYFASIYIGDSQSMAVEAALLGTPSIRHNYWVGKVSVLEELESEYGLTYGITLDKPQLIFDKIDYFMEFPNLKQEWLTRRNRMLRDKIDVTAFFVWYIEHYPQSPMILNKDKNYQLKFREEVGNVESL